MLPEILRIIGIVSLIFAVMIYLFVFGLPFRRRKDINKIGEDNLKKFLQEYADDKGNIVIDKLAKIWVTSERVKLYSQDEVENILDKTTGVVEKEMIARAEGTVVQMQTAENPDLDASPVEEKVASILGDDFLPKLIGDRKLDYNGRVRLAESVYNYLKEKGFLDTSFPLEMRDSLLSELKQKLFHSPVFEEKQVSNVSSKASDVVMDVIKEQNALSLLPSELIKYLASLGYPVDFLNNVRISSSDSIKYSAKFDLLKEEAFRGILEFYLTLHNKGILKYFYNSGPGTDYSKYFRDFLLFLLDNYRGEEGGDIFSAFEKIFLEMESLACLEFTEPNIYRDKKISEAKKISFGSILIAYKSLNSSDFKEAYNHFVSVLKKYINIKDSSVAYRQYDCKKDFKEVVVSYDHIGFYYSDDVYLIPKAVDIIFGSYMFALPFYFADRVEFPEPLPIDRPSYVGKFKIQRRKDDGEIEERVDYLIKLKKGSVFYNMVVSSLDEDRKEIKIPNYKGLLEVKAL